jgi:hypothetical protein
MVFATRVFMKRARAVRGMSLAVRQDDVVVREWGRRTRESYKERTRSCFPDTIQPSDPGPGPSLSFSVQVESLEPSETG